MLLKNYFVMCDSARSNMNLHGWFDALRCAHKNLMDYYHPDEYVKVKQRLRELHDRLNKEEARSRIYLRTRSGVDKQLFSDLEDLEDDLRLVMKSSGLQSKFNDMVEKLTGENLKDGEMIE